MSARNWLFSLLCGGVFVVAGAIAGHAADGTAAPASTPAAASTQVAAAPAAAPEYAPRGADSCMRCHDSGSVLNILKTPHAMKGDSRTPFAQYACESCHGASPDHMNKPPAPGGRRSAPAVVFNGDRKSPAEVINKVCLTCHENGLRMNWKGSQHQSNDVACTDCHQLHTTKGPMVTREKQPFVCFKCHAEQRALTLEYSHHPIREGKVVCSDCHNPHGSAGPDLLKEVRVTDVCYNCHPEKRGPYLWEHQPVREDCTNCHNPHGSVNARLLKEKVPFLCEDCHANPGNGADMGGFGVNSTQIPQHGTLLYTSGDRGCLNCHSQIHGSNSPSGSSFFR